MEDYVDQAATSGLSEMRPPRMAAAGTGNRPRAGHLGIEQMQGSKVEIC